MKSHASDLVRLATCVYEDAVAKCSAVMDQRDLSTIRTRVEHEGVSFLTITLPDFGKDFERCLAEGRVDPSRFRSFKKRGAIPAFLQGMLGQVFDLSTGRIYENVHHELVEGIRQICHTFRKVRFACTVERQRQAVDEFAQIELDLQLLEEGPLGQTDGFNTVSRVLWSSVISGNILTNMLPKHGPGATAERISGNQKYRFKRWHERLESFLPFLGSALHVRASGEREFNQVQFVGPNEEQPVKVTLVPKTLKGPRVIAIEPVCMQYAQQALSKALVECLESAPLTKGHVNFTDQGINRALALTASKTGQYCTIDLSSASDRVPRSRALDMFSWFPELRDAIDACRSTHARLPSGDVLRLRKFASMGSALCFPVEAMYFYTCCVAALLEKHNLPATPSAIRKVAKDVYVYGDDIIVPTDAADVVVKTLQRYNCKVNTAKSFWSGKFRESCGMDAYDGYEVTPTYLRHPLPGNKRNDSALISLVSTANSFYKKGYWRTTTLLRSLVERRLGKLPFVTEDSPGLGWVSFLTGYDYHRWSHRYHRLEVKTWVPSPVYQKDRLDDYPALSKCLLRLEARISAQPSEGKKEKHLDRTARHGAVVLQRRWVTPY